VRFSILQISPVSQFQIPLLSAILFIGFLNVVGIRRMYRRHPGYPDMPFNPQ